MAGKAAFAATIHGLVQGVGFRFYVNRLAREMDLSGYVRNLPGGTSVEVKAEGERDKLEELLKLLQIGPRMSRVDSLKVEWLEPGSASGRFQIRF